MSDVHQGGCQCGAVRYRIDGEPVTTAACHCRDCQMQSGSAFGMSMILSENQFAIAKGEPKRFTKTADSGVKIDCVFCDQCGTRICHVPQGKETVNVKPGTLDDTSWFSPSVHVWTRSKQPWVVIPEGAACLETQPQPKGDS
jgi:hypothetical protein